VHPERRTRSAPEGLNGRSVVDEEPCEALRCFDRAFGRDPNSFQEERQPGFPVAVPANVVKQVVVLGSMLLEKETEIQERFTKYAGVAQQQRDEKPSDTSVAIEERMDRLKLHVRQPRTHKYRKTVVLGVHEAFERGHAVR
jgi:hypothetical protein